MNRKRLEALLRVRSLQERGARGELARRRRVHQHAVDAERHTWERLDREVAETSTSDGLLAMHAVRDSGLRAAESQHLVTGVARDEAVVARDGWTIAARRVEALDRLTPSTVASFC